MAKIVYEGDERTLPDGSDLIAACEEMNYPFGCQDGKCGTCVCTVVSGNDNLESLSEKEQDFGLEEGERLVCQLVIKEGTVEISMD